MGVTAKGHYTSFAEFEREEIRPMQKLGFTVADLEAEAFFGAAREDSGSSEPEELDFG